MAVSFPGRSVEIRAHVLRDCESSLVLKLFPFCDFQLQEETEMWKIREWEKQTEETYWKRQSRMLSDTSR